MAAHFPFGHAENDPFHNLEDDLPETESPDRDSRPFLGARLRNSIKRKLSHFSPFGRRPNSCHFDFRFSSSEAQSLCVSSHSLLFPMAFPASTYPAVTADGILQGGPAVLFLPSPGESPCESSENSNSKKSRLSSVLRESLRNGSKLLKRSSSTSSKSLQEENSKGREIRTYIKKMASKRRDKISSSVSSLSVKVRERNFLKQESHPAQGRRSIHEDFLLHSDEGQTTASGEAIPTGYPSRQRSNTVTGANESASSFRRNYAFRSKRTSQEIPSQNRTPLFFSPKEGDEPSQINGIATDIHSGSSEGLKLSTSNVEDRLASHNSYEKIRFIDSSSEEELEPDCHKTQTPNLLNSFSSRDRNAKDCERSSELTPQDPKDTSKDCQESSLPFTNPLSEGLNRIRSSDSSSFETLEQNCTFLNSIPGQNVHLSQIVSPSTAPSNSGVCPKLHKLENDPKGINGQSNSSSNYPKICYAKQETLLFEETVDPILDYDSLSDLGTFEGNNEVSLNLEGGHFVAKEETKPTTILVLEEEIDSKDVSRPSSSLSGGWHLVGRPRHDPHARRCSSKSLSDLTSLSLLNEGRSTIPAGGHKGVSVRARAIQASFKYASNKNMSSLKYCHSLDDLSTTEIVYAPLASLDLDIVYPSFLVNSNQTHEIDNATQVTEQRDLILENQKCQEESSSHDPSDCALIPTLETPEMPPAPHSLSPPKPRRPHKRRRRGKKVVPLNQSGNKSELSEVNPKCAKKRRNRRNKRKKKQKGKEVKVTRNDLLASYQRTPKLGRKKVRRSASAACKLFSLSCQQDSLEDQSEVSLDAKPLPLNVPEDLNVTMHSVCGTREKKDKHSPAVLDARSSDRESNANTRLTGDLDKYLPKGTVQADVWIFRDKRTSSDAAPLRECDIELPNLQHITELPRQHSENSKSQLLCHLNNVFELGVTNYGDYANSKQEQEVVPDCSDTKLDAIYFVRFLFPKDDDSLNEYIRWALTDGEEQLASYESSAITLTGINHQVSNFEKFFSSAQEQVEKGLVLLKNEEKKVGREEPSTCPQDTDHETGDSSSQDLTKVLSQHLSAFADKLHLTKDRLEDTAKCYLLLDKAYEWALDAMKVVDQVKSSGVASPEQVGAAAKAIGNYLQENPSLSEDAFDAMLTLATRLNNHTLLQQCKVAQSRCQETTALLKSRHSTLLKARRQMEFDCQSYVDLNEILSGSDEPSPFNWLANSSLNSSGRRRSVSSLSSRTRDPLSRCSSLETEDDASFSEPQSSSTPVKPCLESRASLGDIKELRESAEDLQVPSYSTQSKRPVGLNHSSPHSIYASSILAFSSGSSSCSSSESSGSINGKGNTHHWRFSEISSQSAEDSTTILDESLLPHLSKTSPPSSANSHLLIRGSQINLTNSGDLTQEEVKKSKTLLLIMQELIQTERDYVNSLEYIIENYIPELMREDIPQALRGQRNVIFGNLEKIYEFHSGYFLSALEACQSRPFSVGSIFLKYESQFYLYALYNKNKPKSDCLMSEYGSSFFKNKQIELGDRMDLSSYLLKPVQRMGKYALLLKQLLKDCARSEEGCEYLESAQEMVQFQLRHGNDLLAMDSLRDCDVNLKEQGRLLRQGEFFVSEGSRKKSFRHVFLFEDLILFSKARKDPEKKTLDIFQYKHSIKMTDIGLTEQMGDSSNKFEIWFRKRKPSDTYILQANTPEMKESWTEEISKLLWRQALRNRTLRLHEMSSMGIGNKPCLDIRPSEDQINDRSVYIGRAPPRLRPSLSQPTESLLNSQRPHSVISISSSSSSAGSSSQSSAAGPTFTGNLNLGFEPGDSPRSLTRSATRTSQCSAESGILADIYPEKDGEEAHYKVERSNSSVTTVSADSALSPCSPSPPELPSTCPSSSSLSASSSASTVETDSPTHLSIPVAKEDSTHVGDVFITKSVLTTEV